MKPTPIRPFALAACTAFSAACLAQAAAPVPPKPATAATKAANQQVLQSLPFGDKADFDDARAASSARPTR